MNSLPISYIRADNGIIQTGYEIVSVWSVRNFTNNKTFYTDSNGLEMQERILNYRPTWDI